MQILSVYQTQQGTMVVVCAQGASRTGYPVVRIIMVID
jgi:hypothetical protein